jgi:hypothetical protein
MPWHCPACRTTITHNEAKSLPRPGAVYRCYVCHLELVFNKETSKFELLPFTTAAEAERDIPSQRPRRETRLGSGSS